MAQQQAGLTIWAWLQWIYKLCIFIHQFNIWPQVKHDETVCFCRWAKARNSLLHKHHNVTIMLTFYFWDASPRHCVLLCSGMKTTKQAVVTKCTCKKQNKKISEETRNSRYYFITLWMVLDCMQAVSVDVICIFLSHTAVIQAKCYLLMSLLK